ncbi:MAG: hypothetical protein ACLR8P_15380 [Clostridium fessum]
MEFIPVRLIYFYGCRNLIRIGTAGALRPEAKGARAYCTAMGSVRHPTAVNQ